MFLLLWSKCEGRESELNTVTCGSLLKLLNTRHNVRLHSHDVKYGSGNFTRISHVIKTYFIAMSIGRVCFSLQLQHMQFV